MPKSTAKKRTSGLPRVVESPPDEFLAGVVLQAIRFTETETKYAIVDKQFPRNPKIGIKCQCFEQSESVQPTVLANFSIRVESGKANSDRSHLLIHAVIQCVYATRIAPSGPQDLKALSGFAGIAAWPYAREFVSSATSRMALPPLVLPPIRVDPTSGKVAFVEAD